MDYQVTEYATSRQKALLKSKGVTDEQLANLTKKEASNFDDLIEKEAVNGQGYAGNEKNRVSRLLEVAQELIQHVQASSVYQKLNDEQKLEAFRALLNAYALTTKKKA